MLKLAFKMLIGNKASCLGVIFGIFLATLLITQQSAIFLGLVARSYRLVTDIPAPNVWVMDPATESDEKVRPFPAGYLDVVRGVPGVEWAVPINVTYLPVVSASGVFDTCKLYGIDDETLIGAPPEIIEGKLKDLRRQGSVIVDVYSANTILAHRQPDGTRVPLKLGDTFEINRRRAVVVGICEITQGFYPQPIIFASNSQFHYFTAFSQNDIEFIAARTKPGVDTAGVIKKIDSHSSLLALTKDDFQWRIAKSFLQTGILINFGLSVALGIIIGFSIAGQVFYIMTLQNMSYYALIKAVGGDQGLISRMIATQVAIVGTIGFLLGTGATILWGMAVEKTTLAFLFPWQLLLFSAIVVFIICLFTAGLSIRKVFSTDAKMLMGN